MFVNVYEIFIFIWYNPLLCKLIHNAWHYPLFCLSNTQSPSHILFFRYGRGSLFSFLVKVRFAPHRSWIYAPPPSPILTKKIEKKGRRGVMSARKLKHGITPNALNQTYLFLNYHNNKEYSSCRIRDFI